MTGLSRSTDGLDPRRKRILFRAWHRGTREMDLLMGQYAEKAIDAMSDAELDIFEALIEVPDRDLFAGSPQGWRSPQITIRRSSRRSVRFTRTTSRLSFDAAFSALPTASLAHALEKHESLRIGGVADGALALVLAEIARLKQASGADQPALALFVARDGLRQAEVQGALAALFPEIEVISLPAWDCQPYDRASPNAGVLARRMEALARLVRTRGVSGRAS